MSFSTDSEASSAVEDRMALLRGRLRRDARACRQARERWTDWRAHVRAHPWLAGGAAALVGYLLVPDRRTAPAVATETVQTVVPARWRGRSLLGRFAAALAGRAAQQALSIGTTWAMERMQGAPANGAPHQRRPTTNAPDHDFGYAAEHFHD